MVQQIGAQTPFSPPEMIEDRWAQRLIIGFVVLGLALMGLRNWEESMPMVSNMTVSGMTPILPPIPPFNLPPAIPSFSYPLGLEQSLNHWLALRPPWLSVFDLTRLPPDLQRTLATILLLPFSALVTTIYRNLIGLSTFGTFVPPLLALALVSTSWQVGLILIGIILVMGFGLRRVVDPLKLLMLPRLGILLTFAVWSSVFGVSGLNVVNPNLNQETVLLPMVILTGLIERLFVTLEEDGIDLTIQRLLGTFVVAVSCYLVLSSAWIGQFVLTYPEVHLWTIAAMIWLGRYSGYRLSELRRFRDLTLPTLRLRELRLRKLSSPSSIFANMTALSPGFDSYASLAFAPFQDLWAEPKTALRRLHLTLSYAFPPAHMDHRLPEELVELVAPASTQDAAATTTALTLEPYWCWPWQLEELGILGINRRNSSYVFCHNDRAHYPLVDNKVLTKEVCGEQGIASAETYGVIESVADVQYLITWIENYPSFVIKPARGAGGKGILVIDHHDGIDFVTASGRKLSIAQIQHHLTTVLAGTYSLGQQPDVTIVEQRVLSHPALAPITVGGVPDIRVIVFQGVPAMAMTRLPTQLSEGRANLHQGAVAAAIDLVSGQTSGGVWQNHMIDAHPDTGHSLEGFQIPYWDQILAISTKLGHSLGLGYIGVDLVIDSEQGPMVLDVNARPGLAIQIANGQGLHHRLAFIANQLPEALEADRCLDLLPQLSQSSLNQSSLNQRALHDRV